MFYDSFDTSLRKMRSWTSAKKKKVWMSKNVIRSKFLVKGKFIDVKMLMELKQILCFKKIENIIEKLEILCFYKQLWLTVSMFLSFLFKILCFMETSLNFMFPNVKNSMFLELFLRCFSRILVKNAGKTFNFHVYKITTKNEFRLISFHQQS